MWEYDYSTLCHGMKGHKYIRKERGNNGKWNYIYPDDLKRKYDKTQSDTARSIEEQKRSEEKQRKEENARKIHEERMKNDQGYRLSFAEKQRKYNKAQSDIGRSIEEQKRSEEKQRKENITKYNKTQSDIGRSIEEQKHLEDNARNALGSDFSKRMDADGVKEFVSISEEINDNFAQLSNLIEDNDIDPIAKRIKENYLRNKLKRCYENLKELGSKYKIKGEDEINRLYDAAQKMKYM